jgi:polyisoprenoid-binding protein YceI
MRGRFVGAVVVLALAAAAAAGRAEAQAAKKGAPAKRAKGKAAAPAPAPALLLFEVAPTGNEARYRVREQLAGLDLPNDAVGATPEVSGALFVYGDGRVVRDSSRFVVNLTSLKSDKDRRDNYLRRRTLLTDSFPSVQFVPTAFRDPSGKPLSAASRSLELVGDLTIRGVTRPTTWQVVLSTVDSAQVSGSATTAFTFADFGLTQPKVPVVLSVADTIKLEYDFKLVPKAAPKVADRR